MNGSHARRAFLLLPFACVALYGCPSPEETQPTEEYADVIYEGETTDEAMIALGSALDQAPATDDPARNPLLDAPAAGALARSPIPTFQWHVGGSTRAPSPSPATRALAFAGATAGQAMTIGNDFIPGQALSAHREGAARATWPAALAQLFGPPRAARAHGSPLNGPATFLVFASKSDAKLLRVLTDKSSYTPSQEAWDKLTGESGEITLSLMGAEFDNNRIADSGGPFAGAATTFTLTDAP